jgi:hypothetical protein
MSGNPAHVIAEAFGEVQVALRHHLECGVGVPGDALARINRVMSAPALIRAMYAAGFFPSNNPPDEVFILGEP